MTPLRMVALMMDSLVAQLLPPTVQLVLTKADLKTIMDQNYLLGGAIFAEEHGIINMSGNVFVNNNAFIRGVLFSNRSTIILEASEFHDNTGGYGGVQYISNSIVTIKVSKFHNNHVYLEGGILYSSNSTVTIEASEFHKNIANAGGRGGGRTLHSVSSNITIEASEFYNNGANGMGRVLHSSSSTITIDTSGFHNNSAIFQAGVLHFLNSSITIGGSNFTNNSAPIGAVTYATGSPKIQYHEHLLIDSNSADGYAVILLSASEFNGHDSGNITFSHNLGSLVAFNSNVTFSGYAAFVSNQPGPSIQSISIDDFQEGGALTIFIIYMDLANLVLASLLVVHTVSSVLVATGQHYS